MKRWFLTVDWCSKGNRGIFCSATGNSFSKETQHSEDEMCDILGAFEMVLAPQSLELSEEELKEYHRFIPLAEYTHHYGIATKSKKWRTNHDKTENRQMSQVR
ncbi:MAG: hypothetical protein Q8M94_12005 [Ignavibacteria bacterium]|nr:hypothetical protein [Ignavibacteria bacterium]